MKTKRTPHGLLRAGLLLLGLFLVWTALVLTVDVQPAGQSQTAVGFATLNTWFHTLTGVHLWVYAATDWLGLIPVFVCLGFGCLGVIQLIRRRSLRKVDFDILLLGIYYVVVICAYLFFEMFPINYRPILIDGFQEASYPSSTTLLVLSVMPTLTFQAQRRLRHCGHRQGLAFASAMFTGFMVIGRLLSGVHWMTDIIGSVLLSRGLFLIYTAAVGLYEDNA